MECNKHALRDVFGLKDQDFSSKTPLSKTERSLHSKITDVEFKLHGFITINLFLNQFI